MKAFMKWFGIILILAMVFAAMPVKKVNAAGSQTLFVSSWSDTTPLLINGRPTVLYDGTTYHMWYGSDATNKLFYASSATPTGFTAGTEAFFDVAPLENTSVTVVKEEGVFYLITYGATNKIFSIYTSPDGIDWTYMGDVFDGNGLATYDGGWQKFDAPSLLVDGDKYKLYFQVKSSDGINYAIFMAESDVTTLAEMANGNNDNDFTLANSNQPVLTKGATGDPDETRVMHPDVVKVGSTYFMSYTGVKPSAYFTYNVAFSSDGINWTKGRGNPVLASTSGDYAEPRVVVVGDTWNLWYMFGGSPIKHVSATGPFDFLSIQAAINAAVSGDTVMVAAGTYVETGQIVLDKNLTLIGSDKDTAIIKPAQNTSGSGDTGSWILVNDGVTFNISKVTLDGIGKQIRQGIRFNGSGVVDNVIIQNMVESKYAGFGIAQGYDNIGPRTLSITNSIIRGFERIGIQADNGTGTSTVTIANNVITCQGPGDNVSYGITVEGGAHATISNNEITNCYGVALSDSSESAAIEVSTYYASGTTAIITGNNLHDNLNGLLIGYDGSDTSTVVAENNKITNVTNYGLYSTGTTVTVDADRNWWGTSASSVVGTKVDGPVTYAPYWVDEAMTILSSTAPSIVYVDDDFTSTVCGGHYCGYDAFATIKDGVTVVANGGTVNVAAGTYDTPTLINKSVTLLGSNAVVNPNTGTRVAEAIIQGSTLSGLSDSIVYDAENIILKGFTIQNLRIDNYNGNAHEPINGDVIENNIFTSVVGTAIYLRDGRDAPGIYSTGVSISNNSIVSPGSAGNIDYNAGTGILLYGASNSTINGNVITNAAYNGIQLGRDDGVTVSNNIATGASQPALQIAQWNDGSNTISDNTFSTLSTTKAAVRLYGFANEYFPIFKFTGNTIKDSVFGVQIGREDTGLNDIVNADYSFTGNSFTNIDTYRLIVYLTSAATPSEITEMDSLFAQIYATGSIAKAITSATPWTYVVATCTTECYVATTGSDTNIGSEALPFLTIQKGIDSVSSGGNVHVAAGTYVENVLVNKSVEIGGAAQGSTIVMPSLSEPNPCTGSSLCGGLASNVFLIQANDVTIHDLTIDGDNPDLNSNDPTKDINYDVGGANLDARNGIITNHSVGVFNNLVIYNTTVKNIYLRGIYPSSGGTFNIHHNTVTNVQGDDSSIAIFGWGGPGIFANNLVSFANDAISANWSTGIQFVNNTVTHSRSGIHTDNAGGTLASLADLIKGNSIDCTGVKDAYGIFIFSPYKAPSVDQNTITNCAAGLTAFGQAASVTEPVTTQFTNNIVTGDGSVGSTGALITTILYGYDYTNVYANFAGNTITGFETGVQLWAGQLWGYTPWEAKTIGVTFNFNNIYGNTSAVLKDSATGATYTDDFTKNWWGSILGPQAPISTNINVNKWCSISNPGCYPLLPDDSNTITLSGTVNQLGGFNIYAPNLNIILADGTVVQNDNASCFDINASYTTIKAQHIGGAKCIPAAGKNGINVAPDLVNVVINGLEISGPGNDGIHFGGAVTDLLIVDNWIHDLAENGITFTGQPTGVISIQGNLFQNNTGKGIDAGIFTIPAEFNSWGNVDGATAGDGASAGVDADPWTYVDLYLKASNAPSVNGTVKYTIYGNFKNVYGTSFTLKYPTSVLQIVTDSAINKSQFTPAVDDKYFTIDTVAGTIRFDGIVNYANHAPAVSGLNVPIFEVTFLKTAAGSGLLDLDETSDRFTMAPNTDPAPSSNIYAAALLDSTLPDAGFTVTGAISMQGRIVQAGVPASLINLYFGPYTATSIEAISKNLSFSGVAGGSYLFTTNQPRYLNITADLNKMVNVSAIRSLPTLELKGGNAVWTNNKIDINDAVAVGNAYGINDINNNADVNFDGVVGILDLTLVGVNFDKTSETIYASWVP